jgi:hypothetical protein
MVSSPRLNSFQRTSRKASRIRGQVGVEVMRPSGNSGSSSIFSRCMPWRTVDHAGHGQRDEVGVDESGAAPRFLQVDRRHFQIGLELGEALFDIRLVLVDQQDFFLGCCLGQVGGGPLSRKIAHRSVLPLLRALEKRRWTILKNLTHPQRLLIGTVYDVLRRCGNPSCACAKTPTHLQTLFMSVHQGKRRCQFIRQEDLPWVREASNHYKEFRQALREIRALNRKELTLLGVQMKRKATSYE